MFFILFFRFSESEEKIWRRQKEVGTFETVKTI